jgi:uncharacterized protein (TIGR02118 family)
MIRLTAMLRRNPALSADEFNRHWRTTHADLMRGLPGAGERIVRYEQHPRLADTPGGWTGSRGVDGMAVQWFDSLDDLLGMIGDPTYQATVQPDERHLLDLDRSLYLVTSEPRVIIDRS